MTERSTIESMRSILPTLLSAEHWPPAWKRVRENHGRPGADGISIEQFEAKVDHEITCLREELRTTVYHPWPLLELRVEETVFNGAPRRPGGKGEVLKRKQRLLRIPAVRDRVMQAAVMQRVEPWIDEQLEACSFAYRHGRGVQDAVEEVRKWHVRGYQYLVDADIESFFDNVDHGRVLNKFSRAVEVPLRVELLKSLAAQKKIAGAKQSHDLVRNLEDAVGGSRESFQQLVQNELRRLAGLITQWVQAEVWDGRQITWLKRGLPQGSVISPMLANLFLDELDEALLGHDLKLVRYSDDFVILCRTPKQAENALLLTEQKLAEMHLGLNPRKTTIRKFENSFKFLGVFFWKDLTMLPFEKRIRERRVLSLPPPLPPELAARYQAAGGRRQVSGVRSKERKSGR
jgi:retron-type reverse transcriptase